MTQPEMTAEIALDARDLLCPLPVLKARKRLMAMAPGQVLAIETTDPAALIDMPHFCAETGNAYLGVTELDGASLHRIRKT